MEKFTFSEARNEIENYQVKHKIPGDMIQVTFEKNEFILRIFPLEVTQYTINEALALAKKHIENWRIHSFDKGFVSVQALNDNIFDNESILSNLKIRISSLFGEKMVEVSKKNELKLSDLDLIYSLIKAFCTNKKANMPELLSEAGCHVYLPEKEQISFDDFAGYKSVKNQIQESIVLSVKHPEVYDKIAEKTRVKFEINRPRAVLFAGPPGVGKTTMARILAKETGYMLVYIPLENIMSSFYGESSKKLAAIFDIASRSEEKGMVLFLDEIDSLAPSRNKNLFEATRRMLSVLLRTIDGIESKSNFITIGATNRKEDLDAALISRFDTIIDFGIPTEEDIEKILELYTTHLKEEDRKNLSAKMKGYSPRSIKDICKMAERVQARINIDKNKNALPGINQYIQAMSMVNKNENEIHRG